MSAIIPLSNKLREMHPLERRDLALKVGIPLNAAARACYRRGIHAEAYLVLCAAVGLDAVTGEPCEPDRRPRELHWWMIGTGLHLKLDEHNLNLRKASKRIGVSAATLSRLLNSSPVSVDSLLKICAFIGVHPMDYTSPVSRETATETTVTHSGVKEVSHVA